MMSIMELKWFLSAAFVQVLWHSNSVNKNLNKGQLKGTGKDTKIGLCTEHYPNGFQMPFNYPRYTKFDYDNMEDWKLDTLLGAYGLCFEGPLEQKRAFVVGTFLWPDQL